MTTVSQTRNTLRACAAALVAVLVVTLVPATPADAVDSRTEGEIRSRLERKVNRARERRGLRRLKVNARTQRYAQDHAETMARSGFLFHDSSLSSEVIHGATAWGENIGFTSADNAVKSLHKMFMNSSGHRAIILRKRWTHMGIGVEKRNGKVWVVQRFADGT